LEYLSLV